MKQVSTELLVFGRSRAMKYVFLNNQSFNVSSMFVNVNFNEPIYYPFVVSVNKCIGSCNTIDDAFAWIRVSNKASNMNARVFNLMSRIVCVCV